MTWYRKFAAEEDEELFRQMLEDAEAREETDSLLPSNTTLSRDAAELARHLGYDSASHFDDSNMKLVRLGDLWHWATLAHKRFPRQLDPETDAEELEEWLRIFAEGAVEYCRKHHIQYDPDPS